MPIPKRTIYLSSTFEDLKDHRKAVFKALRKSGYDVKNMEEYVAANVRPLDQCLADVREADIYVGMFGFRYGYVPPEQHNNPQQLSITELEFQEARANDKPCLAFVAKEDVGVLPKYMDAYTGDGENGEQIKRLRQSLLAEQMVAQFSTPEGLATEVLAAVKIQESTLSAVTSTQDVLATETRSSITWDIEKLGSPYPGLLHFTRKYALVFFGREIETQEILNRFHGPQGRFMIISGDSGVGKSSLVDAGVLPALEAGRSADIAKAMSLRMVPSQKQQPMEALLNTLTPFITQAGLLPDSVSKDLANDPHSLGAIITKIMKQGADTKCLVLFIDQMEELFTAQDLKQTHQFLSALYQATQDNALKVIGTIRSDHLHFCHRHVDMLNILNSDGHYALGPVQPSMMQDMIRKPAQAAGLSMSEGFAKRLIHDTESDAVNLPLLAFVLNKLFDDRHDHELRESAYDALGGVTGAIAAHVKEVESAIAVKIKVDPTIVLPDIFQTLVKLHKDEGTPTRNRPLKSIFTGQLEQAVDVLIEKRLLRTEGDGADATVSISHEALFGAWPALKRYVDTHKKTLIDRTHLESRAQKWEAIGKPWLSGLATGQEFKDFRQAGLSTTTLTQEFLHASQRARQLWRAVGLMAILLLGLVTWLWQKGYNVEQALLKIQSVVVSIHRTPPMVPIPEGTYQQGDIEEFGESWRNPVREVTIAAFSLSQHEVTFEAYDRFAIDTGRELPNDQGWGRGKRPVINVTWEDARDYAAWLAEETGEFYRLPSESEWEYAARSGVKQEEFAGTNKESELAEFAVYRENSGNRTAEVGSKQENEFKLKDMGGNVWEWVEDCWHENYQNAPDDGRPWLEAGDGDYSQRVVRGGSWGNEPGDLRASARLRDTPDFRYTILGFRLAQGTR